MSQGSKTQGEAVKQDQNMNIGVAIYLSSLAIGGAVIMMLGYKYHWGFWGWFGGGLLVFAGVGGLGSMWATGGVGSVECPNCSHPIEVMHISLHRIVGCPQCHTYLEGAEVMKPVEGDYLAKQPSFEAPVPANLQWPEGCPVCRQPVSGTVKIEGTSSSGAMASLMLPVSFHRVNSLQVPQCSEHKDGVWLHLVDGGSVVSFRSYAYWKEFCELNQIELSYQPSQDNSNSSAS